MDKQEAIKILKEFHDTSALFSVRTALETVFPELKESEDEKIRKTLIEYFNAYPKDYFGGLKKAILLLGLKNKVNKSLLNGKTLMKNIYFGLYYQFKKILLQVKSMELIQKT